MPTGYTADVQDGKITTLSAFALTCARAFGATITIRDDPFNKPIPEQFEPQLDYYTERKIEAQKILAELPNLSLEECNRRAIAEHANALNSNKEYEARKEQSRQNYASMIAKVEKWQVPEELTEFRAFMLEQLRTSRRIDCATYEHPKLFLKTPEEWRNTTLAAAAHDLAYALEHIQAEIKRTDERNIWLKLLRDSLKEDQA